MVQVGDSSYQKNVIILEVVKQYINATSYFKTRVVIGKVSFLYEWGNRVIYAALGSSSQYDTVS